MHYTVTVRGKSSEWSMRVSDEQALAMKEDGFEVVEIHNSMPAWVADTGLAQLLCDVQDLWDLPARLWRK